MRLLEEDELYLTEKGYVFETVERGSELHVVIHNYPLPEAYTPQAVDLLIKIPPGYPNAKLDMFWTDPRVTLTAGSLPQASAVFVNIGGKQWQRWSRHWQNSWRAGVDGLETYLGAVRHELSKGI